MTEEKSSPTSLTYRDAGVDSDAAMHSSSGLNRSARPLIVPKYSMASVALALCVPSLPAIQSRFWFPGTDGVGTKLRLAMELGIHDTIGIDLVAMCSNDIAVVGAEPLFFLEITMPLATLNVEIAAAVVSGIGRGCELAGAGLGGR